MKAKYECLKALLMRLISVVVILAVTVLPIVGAGCESEHSADSHRPINWAVGIPSEETGERNWAVGIPSEETEGRNWAVGIPSENSYYPQNQSNQSQKQYLTEPALDALGRALQSTNPRLGNLIGGLAN